MTRERTEADLIALKRAGPPRTMRPEATSPERHPGAGLRSEGRSARTGRLPPPAPSAAGPFRRRSLPPHRRLAKRSRRVASPPTTRTSSADTSVSGVAYSKGSPGLMMPKTVTP